MPALVFNKFEGKILVISPFYDKIEKIERIVDLAKNYNLTVINGGAFYPYADLNAVEKRFEYLQNNLFNNSKIIYNTGQYDLLFAKQYPDHAISKWIHSKSNVIILNFKNQSTTIITGGGMTPKMNKASLIDNLETSFVSNIDGIPWHNKYYGKYGYIISNNPLTLDEPKLYPFSMQMGNKYEDNFQVYAQEVTSLGLKKTILI